MKSIRPLCLSMILLVTALFLTTPMEGSAKWWEKYGKPEYGGTLIFHTASLPAIFDPYFPFTVEYYWYEHMLQWDTTVDREIWDFKTGWAPSEYYTGQLVEKWEWPDQQTMIAHIRQGVHYHDRKPANGREFTADDVVYHYERTLGQGSFAGKPNPVLSAWGEPIEHVTAKDKYTAVFKFKRPTFFINVSTVTDVSTLNVIECPEVIEQGLVDDWRYACGTGAFMTTDFVESSSLTLDKNPNYWGYDERYPENRLPYVDSIKMLCIPDAATAIAGLRTGKIDWMENLRWQQANNIEKTNPKILQTSVPAPGYVLNMRVDTKPFTDIKVRKALQMSVDRKTIAQTHYGGMVEGKPAGLMAPIFKGWCIPFDEWPVDLKEEYSYNPDRAKELLAEAGYPDGFKTNCIADTNADLEVLQIVKAQFQDVGVDMEIKAMDPVVADNYIRAKKHDQMHLATWVSFPRPPMISLEDLSSKQVRNSTCNNDPVYDELYNKARNASEVAEAQKLVIDTDMYALEKHWGVVMFPLARFVAWQPYFKGYAGESLSWGRHWFWARVWIDQGLKESILR